MTDNTQLTVFKTAGLPSVANIVKALKDVNVGGPGGVIFKMDKHTGDWVYGADQTEVEEGALFAVNPYSFVHGWIAWVDGKPAGEKMVAITEPLPDKGQEPVCNDPEYKGWQLQVGFSLKCISGEDAGLEGRYSATSHGGKQAVQALGLAIAEQVDKDQDYPVPVVTLGSETYKHQKYGKVTNPILTIQKFVSLEGKDKVANAPAADAAATGRRRRVAS